MTPKELVGWLEWLNYKKDMVLADAKRYRRTGEWPRQVGCEMQAAAYGEMIDKLSRNQRSGSTKD